MIKIMIKIISKSVFPLLFAGEKKFKCNFNIVTVLSTLFNKLNKNSITILLANILIYT